MFLHWHNTQPIDPLQASTFSVPAIHDKKSVVSTNPPIKQFGNNRLVFKSYRLKCIHKFNLSLEIGYALVFDRLFLDDICAIFWFPGAVALHPGSTVPKKPFPMISEPCTVKGAETQISLNDKGTLLMVPLKRILACGSFIFFSFQTFFRRCLFHLSILNPRSLSTSAS